MSRQGGLRLPALRRPGAEDMLEAALARLGMRLWPPRDALSQDDGIISGRGEA